MRRSFAKSKESALKMLKIIILWFSLKAVQSVPDANLAAWLSEVNQQLAIVYDREQLALMQSELSVGNELQVELANEALVNYTKSVNSRAAKLKRLQLGDALQRRQLQRLPQLGYEALEQHELAQLYALTANMSDGYKHLKMCAYEQPGNCSLRLVPEVQQLLEQCDNPQEIEYYWLEWRRVAGLGRRKQFLSFMQLYSKTAKANGYALAEDYWFHQLELSGQQALALLEQLMAQLRPLFLQFHAHVRGALRQLYGLQLVPRGRAYPQQLAELYLAKAFRQAGTDWVLDLPARAIGVFNISAALQRRGLANTRRMFWNVAEYFRGLGLPQLQNSLWSHAQPLTQQDADECWHKVWTFHAASSNNFTYCALQDEQRFFNMFEAQLELHYAHAVARQPVLLREEPLPHFKEALGKCFALAASSPRYLRRLGLQQPSALWSSLPARLNRLYIQGLQIVFLLPVFYVLDRYRAELLSGQHQADANEAFWRLTELYTGARAPSQRSNAQFDAPAKLLMEVDDQYTNHLLSTVLQFQLYKHLCSATGEYIKHSTDKPLDLCDLSDQRAIGPALYEVMALGSTLHYREILQQLVGHSEYSMDGLLTYFRPIQDWLTLQNRQNGFEVGWT